MAEIICPACGRTVPPVGKETLRYCPFCAAELGPTAAEELRPGALFEALKATILEGIGNLRKNIRPRGLLDWVIGGDTRWNNDLTRHYVGDVQAASHALARGLAREADADIARDAVELFLFGIYETAEKGDKDSVDLVYVATERNAREFIPLLREADKADLGARYRQKNKKTPLLPVQKEILRALLPKKVK